MDWKSQLPYAYWLHRINGIGNRKLQGIMQMGFMPEELYHMKKSQLEKLLIGKNRITGKHIESIISSRDADKMMKDYEEMIEKKIAFYPCFHPDYPSKLDEIPDKPFALYSLGRLPGKEKKTVAVIGARECSAYGKYIAEKIGIKLGGSGIQVISGLARGIDGIGMQSALLAGGLVFGVLGSGVDVCYPKENQRIYDKLLEQGGIISEFPPGIQPLSAHFPMRNRIISGLADAVIVVEAREKSGTFITVDMALEQGRDVFAVPGRVTDPLSVGCNRLISDGAAMVLKLEELLQGVKGETCNINKEKYVQNEQTEENAIILEILDFEAKTIQNIYNDLNKVKEKERKTDESKQSITLEYVREQLLLLEKSGKIVCLGGYYVKNYE